MIWENIRLQRANTLLQELIEIMDEDPTFQAPTFRTEKLVRLARKAEEHLLQAWNKPVPRERQMVQAKAFMNEIDW